MDQKLDILPNDNRKALLQSRGWVVRDAFPHGQLEKALELGMEILLDIGGDGQRAVELMKNNQKLLVVTFSYGVGDIFWGMSSKDIPKQNDNRHQFVLGDVVQHLLQVPKNSLQVNAEINSISNEIMQDVPFDLLDQEFPWLKEMRTNHNIENYYYEYALITLMLSRMKAGSTLEIIEPLKWLTKISNDLTSNNTASHVLSLNIGAIESINITDILLQKRTRYLSIYTQNNEKTVPMLKITRKIDK